MTTASPTPAPVEDSKEDALKAMAAGKSIVETKEIQEYPPLLYTVVAKDANAAVKWYEKALDAKIRFLYHDAHGKVMHSVVETPHGVFIGVEDHYPKIHMVKPADEGGLKDGTTGGCGYVYISIPKGKGSADESVERMRENGATVVSECEDLFYGHRVGKVIDCYGVGWAFSHKIEAKTTDKTDKAEKKE